MGFDDAAHIKEK